MFSSILSSPEESSRGKFVGDLNEYSPMSLPGELLHEGESMSKEEASKRAEISKEDD